MGRIKELALGLPATREAAMASADEIKAATEAIWQFRKGRDPTSVTSQELANLAIEAAERVRGNEIKRLQELVMGKRPVAFRVRNQDGTWVFFENEQDASAMADRLDIPYQGLYVRDGTFSDTADAPDDPAGDPGRVRKA